MWREGTGSPEGAVLRLGPVGSVYPAGVRAKSAKLSPEPLRQGKGQCQNILGPQSSSWEKKKAELGHPGTATRGSGLRDRNDIVPLTSCDLTSVSLNCHFRKNGENNRSHFRELLKGRSDMNSHKALNVGPAYSVRSNAIIPFVWN